MHRSGRAGVHCRGVHPRVHHPRVHHPGYTTRYTTPRYTHLTHAPNPGHPPASSSRRGVSVLAHVARLGSWEPVWPRSQRPEHSPWFPQDWAGGCPGSPRAPCRAIMSCWVVRVTRPSLSSLGYRRSQIASAGQSSAFPIREAGLFEPQQYPRTARSSSRLTGLGQRGKPRRPSPYSHLDSDGKHTREQRT